MTELKLEIPNINCGHCVHTIQMELGEMEGVSSVNASQEERSVSIAFEPPASEDSIVALLKEINYPPAG